jgi:hypothetical protein
LSQSLARGFSRAALRRKNLNIKNFVMAGLDPAIQRDRVCGR